MSRYKPYPAYKDSGVAWLGEVPEGWATHRLRWMFQRKKETNRPEAELLSVYRDYGVIPKSSRDDNFNKPSEDLSAYQFVERGDLVLNKMKTWQGSIAVSDFEGIVSPAYYVARPLKQMNLRFMHYMLRSPVYISQYNLLSAGIRPNQWDLDFDDFRDLVALLPSSQEQTAIATFLDRETAKLDTLIAKQEKLIELLQEKRQALISHAVTKGLNPDAPMKDSGVAWLGEVPAHWHIDRLKRSIVSCKNGIWGDEAQDDENDIPCVRVADFNRRQLTVVLNDPTIRNVTEKERLGRVLSKGDLLLEKSGGGENQPVGCVVLYDDERPAVCSNFVARIQMASGMDSSYWRYVHAAAYAIKLTTGSINQTSGIQNLDQDRYFDEPVSFPPPPEQRAIAAFLDRETAKIDALIEKSRRSIELMREHRTALISAAVTGKVDVRAQHQAAT